jgi:hypothetical protein
MQEGEAMPGRKAAATTTGEDSLEEAGGGPGAAGRSPSPGSIRIHNPYSKKIKNVIFFTM